MEFHVLREVPENSGNYVETGEIITDMSLQQVADECVMRTQLGMGRNAIYVYDPINRRPVLTGLGAGEADALAAPATGQVHEASVAIGGEANAEHQG